MGLCFSKFKDPPLAEELSIPPLIPDNFGMDPEENYEVRKRVWVAAKSHMLAT